VELKGKTTIVTGSGRGIGRALALEFARQGANVVCCARREHEIRETAEMIEKEGGRALAVTTDVTQKDQVENMVAETINQFGQIDVLFNNAGSFAALGALWEVDPEVWWHDVTVNVRGPMLCCHAVLRDMMKRDEGIIINMTGGGATVPLPGGSGYGCSKAAVIRLTDTLARELERVGASILVFGMGPGFVRTEMTELQVQTAAGRKWIPSSKEALDAKRDRPPEDCAKATVELIRVACKELSGRIFGADTNFAEIAEQASEIHEKDLYVMRMKKAP